MGHHFGVGVTAERDALGLQFALQLPEILNDAVMHHSHPLGDVRMGVALDGLRGSPSACGRFGVTRERMPEQLVGEILELSLGAADGEMSVFQRRDARGIIAAIFEAPQRLHEAVRDRVLTQDPPR